MEVTIILRQIPPIQSEFSTLSMPPKTPITTCHWACAICSVCGTLYKYHDTLIHTFETAQYLDESQNFEPKKIRYVIPDDHL